MNFCQSKHISNNYYEPFIGGDAVYFAINNAKHYFINDKSKDLVDLDKKIKYISGRDIQDRLQKTTIENADFYDFMKSKNTTENDFIFLDPPYDTEFSTYDKNEFTQNDQKRLANFLINETNCKWQLVIKNTDFIYGLYDKKGINIKYFDKSYNVSFMNRNDRKTEHLLITNY